MSLVFGSQTRTAPARRSPFEIRMDILKVTAEGCTRPTHIMYKSNTSWAVLKKHLESLTASGFLLETGENLRLEYSVTSKGLTVFREYANLVEATQAYRAEARA